MEIYMETYIYTYKTQPLCFIYSIQLYSHFKCIESAFASATLPRGEKKLLGYVLTLILLLHAIIKLPLPHATAEGVLNMGLNDTRHILLNLRNDGKRYTLIYIVTCYCALLNGICIVCAVLWDIPPNTMYQYHQLVLTVFIICSYFLAF